MINCRYDGEWLLEDYHDACAYLEALGRTIPRDKWVEELIAQRDRAALAGIG